MDTLTPGNNTGSRRRRRKKEKHQPTSTSPSPDHHGPLRHPPDDQRSPLAPLPASPKPSAFCRACTKWRQIYCDVTSGLGRPLLGFTALFRQVRRPRWKKPRLSPPHAGSNTQGAGGRGGSGGEQGAGRGDGGERELSIFPTSTLWVLHVLVLCVRLYVASRRDNMWILHPDEVYQSVEVAHSEVHGYGYRPYEYLPPPAPPAAPPPAPGTPGPAPPSAPLAAPDTAAERQEAEAGMYSLRSPLWPALFIPPLGLAHVLGITANPLLVAKVFHAFVAAHLPMAVHYLAHALFGCRDDVSIMAAIVTACSCPLSVLGTHTLVNSFLSPLVVFLIGFYIKHATIGYNSPQAKSKATDVSCEVKKVESIKHKKKKAVENIGHGLMNGHVISGNGCVKNGTIPSNTTMLSQDTQTDLANGHANSEHDAKLNSIQNSTKSQEKIKENVTSSSNANCHHQTVADKPNTSATIRQVSLCGVGFGLVTYIRVDLVLQVFVVLVCLFLDKLIRAALNRNKDLLTFHLYLLKGYAAAVLLCGFVDRIAYGYWFLSPYQWFAFNVKNELASILFGEQDPLFYINHVYSNDLVMLISTCVIFIGSLVCISQKDIRCELGSIFLRLIMGYCILLVVYSVQGHKEIRFLHNLIVIHCILFALSIHFIIKSLIYLHNIIKILIVYVTVLVLAFACWQCFPDPARSENPDWTYLKTWDSAHVNECLDFIGRQPDATGVFLDRSIHITAGYSVLHRDIPILSLVHFEFQEFDIESRKSIPSIFGFTNLNVSIMSRVSNFISIKNAPLLLKYLLDTPKYNYLVLKRSRQTIRSGFDDVFFAGPMKVMRRSAEPEIQRHLTSMAERIPIGTNSTILEYEGSWLYTLGQFDKAVARLEAALELDPSRVRSYQLLCAAHSAADRPTQAQEVYTRCRKYFGDLCAQPQEKVVLHSDYNLGLHL